MTSNQQPDGYLTLRLQWLDVLLHRQILWLRARYQLSLDEFRGLYISDEQVNAFINHTLGVEGRNAAIEELNQRAAALRVDASAGLAADQRWQYIATEFGLTPIEEDILLVALAVELDLKYETLYAYLNNDVTRKWPTNDLTLRLLALNDDQRTNVRRCLTSEATLFASGLLQPITQTPDRSSWLANGFAVTPSVSHHVSGLESFEPALTTRIAAHGRQPTWEEIPVAAELSSRLRRIARLDFKSKTAPLIVFSGREGSGRSLVAKAICDDLGNQLVCVDVAGLRAQPDSFERLMQKVVLQTRLQSAGLYLERIESFFDQQGQALADSRKVIGRLAQCQRPVFIAAEFDGGLQQLLAGHRVLVVQFEEPDYEFRLQLWKKELREVNANWNASELEVLADSFVLTPEQIGLAVKNAADELALSSDIKDAEPESRSISGDLLLAAARAQSSRGLADLAMKMKTIHEWNALVLPNSTMHRLREITAAIKYRHIVYSDWGFGRRIDSGLGLKVLFAGPSGTGKTMAAGVIARELGLDAYKIDLSAIVSKYIGETEKNLDRIFRSARSSNAILFFDEADALFGKRSEVKDAHDRYANIEVAYLLQKIEEYEGVVILASNLSQNIDEAFSRRMHYSVDFPLPDEGHREQLWRGMFPPEVPLDPAVDIQFLAKQFSITGGDIRNVALDAAFMAAQDGRILTMKHLIKAMARQLMKQGHVPAPAEFKQYHALIG